MVDLTILARREGYRAVPESVRSCPGFELFVAERDGCKRIGVVQGSPVIQTEPVDRLSDVVSLHVLDWELYEELCRHTPLHPTRVALNRSFGTGDRLGLATAAHLTALRRFEVFPILAQQSPRELERTGRSFKSVLLDAVMGVLESGYENGFGADADHIKDDARLAEALDAGYSMLTLDLSDDLRDPSEVRPEHLTARSRAIIESNAGRSFRASGATVQLVEAELGRSAAVFERALETVTERWQVAKARVPDLDLEVSIDEGDRDTTFEDQAYVAEYLHSRGVPFTSLAPRLPGKFQKGVDYVGDRSALEISMRGHGAIAREIGGYKLSLHSGSDKFSVYPLLADAWGDRFHVKTSGTSWLQALEVVAELHSGLFADMYRLALEKLPESKSAYCVDIAPDSFPNEIPSDLRAFFQERDVRQLLHISYGALLAEFAGPLIDLLNAHEGAHYRHVASHIERHLELLFANHHG